MTQVSTPANYCHTMSGAALSTFLFSDCPHENTTFPQLSRKSFNKVSNPKVRVVSTFGPVGVAASVVPAVSATPFFSDTQDPETGNAVRAVGNLSEPFSKEEK